MRVTVGRLAAAILLAAACLYIVAASGWAAAASGHEHMHAEAGGDWADLLVKLERLAQDVAVMVLVGVLVFRTAILPAADRRGEWLAIERFERIAAVVLLYILLITGSGDTFSVVKAAVAIVWLLAAWGAIPQFRMSAIVKALCALVIVPLLQVEDAAVFLSVPGTIAVLSGSILTASLAVWFGGGISVYAALARRPELEGEQLRLLLARFMTWAAAAFCGIVMTSLFRLWPGSGSEIVWRSGPDGILILVTTLLLLVIAWVAADGYKRWRHAGEDESRQRFRYKQSIRFSLSLTVLVLLLSALISNPVPGAAVLKEPIYWHVMGEEAHMSLRIRERSGGGQSVRLDVWLPSGTGKPDSAKVTLRRNETTVKVPILYKEGGPDPYGFEGFDKYTYEAAGGYVTETGSWNMEVLFTDAGLKQHTYEKVEVIP